MRLRSVVMYLLYVSALVGAEHGRAHAFRTAADLDEFPDDAVVRWREPIALELHRAGEPGLRNASVIVVIERALDAWKQAGCSSIEFAPVRLTDEHATSGDGKNVIEWLDSDWDERGFDPDLPAVTEVVYEEVDGDFEIVEADIYLNAIHHVWVLAEDPNGDERQLLPVMTHEAGHVLGLLHPCELDDSDDRSGPRCDLGDARDPATMYPGYDPAQSTLSRDDIDGVCFLYPSDPAPAPTPGSDEADPQEDAGAMRCAGDAGCADADAGLWDVPFGLECQRPTQCESGRCLERSNGPAICTRECSSEQPCPHGWACALIDGARVCVPREDSGCSVGRIGATQSAPDGSASTKVLIGLAIALWRLRRRYQR